MSIQNPIEIWAAQYSAFREEFTTFEQRWNKLQEGHSENLRKIVAMGDQTIAGIDSELRSKIDQILTDVDRSTSASENSFKQRITDLAGENTDSGADLLDIEDLIFSLKLRLDEEMSRLGRTKEQKKVIITSETYPMIEELENEIQSLMTQIDEQKQPKTFFQKILSWIGFWTSPDTSNLLSALKKTESEHNKLKRSQESSFEELDNQSAIEQSDLLKWHRRALENIYIQGKDAMLTIDKEFFRMNEERESAIHQIQKQKEEKSQLIRQAAEAKQKEAQQLADQERQTYRTEFEKQLNLANQQHSLLEESLITKFENDYLSLKNAESALEDVFATAQPDSPIWNSLSAGAVSMGTTSHFYLGTLTDMLKVNGFSKIVELKCCLPLFAPGNGQPNLVIRYDESTKSQAITLMNSLTGRALVSLPGSQVNVVIGAYSPREIVAPLWQLPVSYRKFIPSDEYPEKEKFRALLTELERDTHIKGSHIQKRNVSNLFELNELLDEDTETLRFNLLLIYNLLQDYLSYTNILINLMKTGPECGNSCIIGIHMEDLDRHLSESHNKQTWDNFERGIVQTAQIIDLRFPEAVAPPDLRLSTQSKIRLENSTGLHLEKTVQFVKKEHDKQDKKILPLSEFILKQENWWQEKAINGISIPFGRQKLSGKEVSLEFLDQQREFGAPHGLVAGGTGSGKSNFLGVLILNACLRYSPDELKLILIDIKGTEFSPFINKLPNLELITTDGDRELVKNIIEELAGKASDRRKIYDQAGVGEYSPYRKKFPDQIFPRYLIIIDEASALFTGDYEDPIRNMLTAGVREYRKFGFHFFFASQRFNRNFSADLLTQCDIRISFSADEETISFIAPSPSHVAKLRSQKNESGHGALLPKGQDPVQFLAYARSLDASGKEYDHVQSILADLTKFAANLKYPIEQTVYLGTQKAVFAKTDNYKLLQAVRGDWPVLLFGEPIGRRTIDLNDKLTNAAGNVFIGGGKEEVAARIIVGLIYSLFAQAKSRTIKIVLFNFFNKSEEENSGWQILQRHFSSFLDKLEIISDIKSCVEYVQKIHDKIQNMENELVIKELTVLCFVGTENMGQVFGKVNEATNSNAKILKKITEDGPSKGIFTIYQVLNVNSYNKFFGSKLNSSTYASAYFLQCCAHRIILQTSLEDSREWLENSKEAAFLGNSSENINNEVLEVNQSKAIYFNLSNNKLFKIKTYSELPSPSDFIQSIS
jgi:hypothetical protein